MHFHVLVSFISITQVIGCEDRIRNDLYYVEWGVKLYSNQPTTVRERIELLVNIAYNCRAYSRCGAY